MSTTYEGVDLDTTELGIRGKVELDDDQAAVATLGSTIAVTFRGRIVKKSLEPGGQNTKPRIVTTVSFEVLDSVASADDLPGQMKLGDEPGEPSDDD